MPNPKTTMIRSYSELRRLPSFEERFEYLKLKGIVGNSTFGYDRYLNQMLYGSIRWKRVRDEIIFRDNGCDLGITGYEIHGQIVIHHMNPLSLEDVESESDSIFDPAGLVCVSPKTHQAIHYGNLSMLPTIPKERRPGDTCPWR